MCDDSTEADNKAFLDRVRLSRRQLGIEAGAAVAVFMTGCATASGAGTKSPVTNGGSDAVLKTTSRRVTVKTPDGEAEAFFVAPASGKHPAVLMWPDVAGLRAAYETMATRLASSGYAVLAVNPYYRSAKLPILTKFSEWRTPEGKAKIAPMRKRLNHEAITRDGMAYVSWLDAQPEVDKAARVGTCGYCMGGPFTFWTAAAVPTRVGAIASFHGGGLATDKPTSPHRLLAGTKVAALICIAKNDDAKDPAAKATLKKAAATAGLAAEIEVYPALHGWCTIDSPVFDKAVADRAWSRMLVMYGRHLGATPQTA